MAAHGRDRDWQRVRVDVRGTVTERLVLVRDVLWYEVNKHDLVRLVIVRDPDGVENDDFFVTTDLDATGVEVATRYAGRWSIEVCFRDVKQDLGGQDPQSWKRKGPERAAASHSGCTPRSGAGTCRPTPPAGPGSRAPGTDTSTPPASSTRSQPYAASRGHTELQQCHPRQPKITNHRRTP
jgi:hypothetical protein